MKCGRTIVVRLNQNAIIFENTVIVLASHCTEHESKSSLFQDNTAFRFYYCHVSLATLKEEILAAKENLADLADLSEIRQIKFPLNLFFSAIRQI